MLLSVLLQAAAAGVGVSKLGAALGAGLAVIGACIGYLFYGGIGKDEYGQATTVTYCLNVIIPVIVGVIAVKLYIPVRIQSIIKKQKNQLNKQFRDMLEALSTGADVTSWQNSTIK